MAISNANAGRVDTMLLKELEHYLPVRMRFLLMLFFFSILLKTIAKLEVKTCVSLVLDRFYLFCTRF